MPTNSPDPLRVLDAILRTNLSAFTEKVFNTVSPGDAYCHNWHIEAIAHELTRCQDGQNTRLIVTQPPRSLKSISSSVAFVAWSLGLNPKLRVITVSYSQELAIELTRQFRLVVESDWYRKVFPNMRLRKNTETQCITSAGGGRVAISIGGSITGRGADIIIIDDPLKAEDAMSEPTRAMVKNWYASTLATRLNDKMRGVIILVMQRLHEDDLAGYLLRSEGWRHLDLPAVAIEDQTITIGPTPGDVYHRKEGDLLHPARESRATLDNIKAEIGSLNFSAQYQQRPVPPEGNLIKRAWFKTYDDPATLTEQSRTVQSWDIALSTANQSDWSVCTTWVVVGKDYYLLDVWRHRLEYPDLKRKIISLQNEYDAQTVLIEKAGLGLGLIQDLTKSGPLGFPKPISINPEGDKHSRVATVSAVIEAGHVALPRDAPWLDDFLHELLGFPNSRHDDQVDSFSQFLNWQRGRTRRMRIPGTPQLIPIATPDFLR